MGQAQAKQDSGKKTSSRRRSWVPRKARELSLMKEAERIIRASLLMFGPKMSILNLRVESHTSRAASTSIRALTAPNQISSLVPEDLIASSKRVSTPSFQHKGWGETKRHGHPASKLVWKSQKRSIPKWYSILNPKSDFKATTPAMVPWI